MTYFSGWEDQPPIRLTPGSLRSLGERQWGMPTGPSPGRAWRTRADFRTATGATRRLLVTMVLPSNTNPDTHVTFETRAVELVAQPADEWVPAHWRGHGYPDGPRFDRMTWGA